MKGGSFFKRAAFHFLKVGFIQGLVRSGRRGGFL
jgi:hypothetical protein